MARGLRPFTHPLRRTGLASDVLHDRDGALAHERDGERVGADSVASGAASGMGGAHTGGRGQAMNENAVLYALSTLAQTCAALAAFVGAIGLFLLQSIREQQRSSEQAMRVSLVDVYSNYHEVVYVLSLSVVLKQVEQVRREPDRAGTTRAKRIEDAFRTWNGFAPRIRKTSIALAVFEGWNLVVILISLGGFAHIPVLTCSPWTSPLLWLVAAITVVVSGVVVGAFVWLPRGDGSG